MYHMMGRAGEGGRQRRECGPGPLGDPDTIVRIGSAPMRITIPRGRNRHEGVQNNLPGMETLGHWDITRHITLHCGLKHYIRSAAPRHFEKGVATTLL